MYKTSSYNYFIEHNNRIIYANGLSNQIFSLSKSEHDNMTGLFNDLISFEINYPSMFSKLVKWGFILNERVDEIDIIRYRNKKATILSKDYHLVVNPTLECNFNCWYCYENHTKGYMDKKTVELVKNHILFMIEKELITSLDLSWFGGEPLLYFYEVIYPISSYAKEICVLNKIPFVTSITTNASKMDSMMIKKMMEINMNEFQITIDGTPERHNKIRNENGIPSFEIIMNNIMNLCNTNKNATIILRINYDDKTLRDDAIENIFKDMPINYRKQITPSFQRVWQTVKRSDQENKKRMELSKLCNNLGFRFNSPSNVFQPGKYYKCYVDRYYHTEINFDGKIYSCTARDYTDEYVTGILETSGEIKWNEERRVKRYAKATFENEMCLACKYLPLCLGPCSQKISETSKDNLKDLCYLHFSEIKPETVIREYYDKKMSLLENKYK